MYPEKSNFSSVREQSRVLVSFTVHRVVVVRYRMHLETRGLSAATIDRRLAAVRRLAYEASDWGLLRPLKLPP